MKKTRKGFKRILTFVVTSLILIANVNAYSTTDFSNAQNGGTLLTTTYSSNIGKAIPQDYAEFAIGINKELEDDSRITIKGSKPFSTEQKNAYLNIENFVGQSTYNANPDTYNDERNVYKHDSIQEAFDLSYADDSLKGYNITYKKVGVYNNKPIDVKLTIVNFQRSSETNSTATLPPYIYVYKKTIGIGTHNVNWVEVKIDFYEAGTTKPVKVKGNTTYWDVDAKQGILLDSTNKGIYVSSNDNVLKSTKIDNRTFVYDPTSCNNDICGADAKNTPTYAFSEIFEGSSLNRVFNFWVRNTDRKVGGGIGLDAEAVVDMEAPVPTKEVREVGAKTGSNELKVKREYEYEYNISQTIPASVPGYYYKSFEITDTLEAPLETNKSNISIKENNSDVTNNFDINVSGQKITVSPKAAYISSADFYGKTYNIIIKTKVKAGADLTSYKQGNDYVIPNHATRTYKDYANKDYTKDTNIVKVIVEPYKLIIHHLEEGTNKKLADDESYNKEYNEKYSTSKSEKVIKDGYTLVSTPSNASGVIIKDTEVTYYYKKQSSIIVEVPKTLANVSKVLLVVGILAIVISVVVIYNNTRKEKSKK